MSGPERIWIEGEEDCPYFYGESELADASGPLVGYVRVDLHDEVVKALRDVLAIAKYALDQWEQHIESDYSGTSAYWPMITEVKERRAALARMEGG